MVKQIIREHRYTLTPFCLVGGLSTALNYSAFYVLLTYFGVNYILSSAIGYISGVFVGFGLNRKYTFRSQSAAYSLESVKYLIVYAISLFLGLGFLAIVVALGVNALLANLIVIGFTTVTNYIGWKYFIFSPGHLVKSLDYWVYRYRYLSTYIVIGVGSIFVELLVIRLLVPIGFGVIPSTGVGFLFGVLFAFPLNSRLNFRVPPTENLRAFKLYVLISTFAYLLNILAIRLMSSHFLINQYSISRFISAGFIFWISYSLHRKFTFSRIKEVGIAIYLVEGEDIGALKEKVKHYPDWIHLDLVDETFGQTMGQVDVSKGYEAKHAWGGLKVMTHILSRKPSGWLRKVAPFSDYLIVPLESDESVSASIDDIRGLGCRPGLSILSTTGISSLEGLLGRVDIVEVLGVRESGGSDQHMDPSAFDRLQALNEMKKRGGFGFDISFVGGVKVSNINRIDAKYIASRSTVLQSEKVAEAIYALKTSSRYYYAVKEDMKRFLRKRILQMLAEIDFVKSGTLVGSFVEKEGLMGISDVDVVVIVDRLTEAKFRDLVERFEQLRPILKADFDSDYDLIINTAFGPLKFNKEGAIVIHLMIYDVAGHILHQLKSPFTCMDWQRSRHHVKSSLSEICAVTRLQPNFFFSSRRGLKDYISDLRSNAISYREYDFTDGVREVKKSMAIDDKDRFEFSYHIMRFCMLNFMKLYNNENRDYLMGKLTESYFAVFPRNSGQYGHYLARISGMKESNVYPQWGKSDENVLSSFLGDFESQFNSYLGDGAVRIYFMRHQKTRMNRPDLFIGQRSDPGIIAPSPKEMQRLSDFFQGKTVGRIYSSSAKRCMQTADLLRESSGGGEVITDADLLEIDYGEADGHDLGYLTEHHPQIVEAWGRGEDPGFPGGESTHDVSKRVRRFLSSLKHDLSKEHPAAALVLTHNVFIRCLVGELSNIPPAKWHLLDIPHMEPLEVLLASDGRIYPNLTEEQRGLIFKRIYAQE